MSHPFRRVLLAAPPGPGGAYLRDAVLDALLTGDAPFIAHTVALSVVDVQNDEHLRYALAAVSVWAQSADALVIYADLGVTDNETRALQSLAAQYGLPVEGRSLKRWQRGDRGPSGQGDGAEWAT